MESKYDLGNILQPNVGLHQAEKEESNGLNVDTDPKTAFLTGLKELMEKYNAKIDIPLLDYDTLGFPDVNVEITIGEAESQINICYPCMKEKSITPSNIFDYDK